MKCDIYGQVTDKIIADLEKGELTWLKPWNAGNAAEWITRPLRHNRLPYCVINVLMLWAAATEAGYSLASWMTFRQAMRRESRMKGVPHGSMSSVQLCHHFPHATSVTAWCEAGMKGQDGNVANAFCRARRRSEG